MKKPQTSAPPLRKILIVALVLAICAAAYWAYNVAGLPPSLVRPQSLAPHPPAISDVKQLISDTKQQISERAAERVAAFTASPHAKNPEPMDLLKVADSYQYGKNGLAKSSEQAVINYDKALKGFKERGDNANAGRVCLSLGKLYKNGDAAMPPDASKAVSWFKKALQYGYEDAYVEIGDIYMHGLHPFYLPDKIVAGQIFHGVTNNPRCSRHIKAVARQRLREITSMSYMDMDTVMEQDGRTYKPLPGNIFQDMYDASASSATDEPMISTSLPTAVVEDAMREEEAERRANEVIVNIEDIDVNLQEMLWNDLTARHRRDNMQRQGQGQQQLFDIDLQTVGNDSQNVHSSSVQTAANKKIDYIIQNTGTMYAPKQAKADFLSAINYVEGLTEEQRENIGKVLGSMKDSAHSKYGKSENEIFSIVWSRINDPANKDRRNDMIKVLAQNMESAIEHGLVVCSTGKIVRTIGSLDGIDKAEESGDMPQLKPEWVLDKELAELAAKIRSARLSAAGEEEREAYDAPQPTPSQAEIAARLTREMQEEFKKQCRSSYIEPKLVDESSFVAKIDTYLENL
jgi:phage protein U